MSEACLMLPVTTMTSVTDREPPQESDRDAIQLYEELLSVATHDLRSPLGAIGIFCELLQMADPPLDPSLVKNVEMIAEATAKAQRILEDASEIGRIYRGIITLAREAVDLRELFQNAAASVGEGATLRGVEIAVRLTGDNFTAFCDPGRTAQVVLCLVEEAAAWCCKGSSVEITGAGGDFTDPASVTVRTVGACRLGDDGRPASPSSLKGRLANRKPSESRYSLVVARRLVSLMGGELDFTLNGHFQATLKFPLAGR